MANIERYEVYLCPLCGTQGSPATLCMHNGTGRATERKRVEVVRADTHAGAVEDNAKLAMAVRYVLHDHRDECPCYGCSTERRYRLGGQ